MSALMLKRVMLMLKGFRKSNVLSIYPKLFNNSLRLSAIAVQEPVELGRTLNVKWSN